MDVSAPLVASRSAGSGAITRDRGWIFASDNTARICPEAWDALHRADAEGPAASYGNDAWTARAADLLREVFETDCEVFFVYNGTAANSLAIGHLCDSYHSVICHQTAHIETDECGGPEFFTNGTKLLLSPGEGGKVTPASVAEIVHRRGDIHYPKPRVLSLTQATEAGTVYSVDELAALRDVAGRLNLRVHMDGARFANAAAGVGVAPREMTWKVGVDVLCFGGTKNGMLVGDAVIFFDRELAHEFDYRCKQAGQLASKMRYLSAPWVGMLESGAWLERARHANRCARRLADGLAATPGVRLLASVEANAVFASLPRDWPASLQAKGWHFYSFIAAGGSRFMCSWETTEADVDALLADVNALAAAG